MKIVAFEEFKQRSIDKNGDIFDFDENNFVNMKTPFKYWCKEHNHLQERTPEQTLRLQFGCTECKIKIKDTQDFINASRKIHQDKFDYSLCSYVNMNVKVELICNDCGDHIFQKPSNNLQGKSCYSCSNLRPITKEDFLKRSRKKFGEKYNYDNIDYVDVKTSIEFVCPIHGLIKMVPRDHLKSKYGCALCAIEANGILCRLSKEEFISKSIDIHGNIFRYDKVQVVDYDTEVLVGCSDESHGYFLTTPHNHFRSKTRKCPKCPKNFRKHKTTEDFINHSADVHKNLYDYSKTIYVADKTKVVVICPKGHEFKVTPNNHLRGKGCGICKASKGELEIVYYLKDSQVLYDREFTFNDCRYKRKLPFDFVIFNEDSSVKGLVEYQGEQHYRKTKFNTISDEQALENFKSQQIRDKIKYDYCKKNGISLLYIHYSDKEHIQTILSQFIRSLDDYLEPL